MRNQRKINEEKFQQIRWKQDKGLFNGESSIYRKPFGQFRILFKLNVKSGETEIEIKNEDFPLLNKRTIHDSYTQAIQWIVKRFEEIDELVKGLPIEVKVAANYQYNRIISEAVSFMLLAKEETKGVEV